MYGNSLLDKLERKFGRYALKNLMTIIVFGTALVWLLDVALSQRAGVTLSSYLYFDKGLILRGQVWRVLTFVFVPNEYNIFFLAVSLYFYWLVGSSLERQWGSFKFDIYYLCGTLFSVISGFLTGYATNYYLHLSLFLAFAILYPNFQVLLFFFIPIKMKWLAFLDLVLLGVDMVFGGWIVRIAILVSLLNIPLFFWRNVYESIKRVRRRRKWQKEIRSFDDLVFEEEEPKVKKFKGKRKDDDDPFEL